MLGRRARWLSSLTPTLSHQLAMAGATVLVVLVVALSLVVPVAQAGIFKFKDQKLGQEELAWRYGAVTIGDEPQISFLYAPPELGAHAGIASRCTRASPELWCCVLCFALLCVYSHRHCPPQ